MKQESQANQEKMGESDQGHVMMPAQPRAGFIMVETDLAFAFFEDGFDRPAQAAQTDKFSQRCGVGCITEVELDYGWVVEVAADNEPEFGTGQTITGLNHAPEGKITHDRPFAAFLDGGPCPGCFRQKREQVFGRNRAVLSSPQFETGRMRAAPFPGWQTDLGASLPQQGRVLDLGEVPLALQSSYTI